MMTNLYVYAIAKILKLPDIIGIETEKLFLITYKDIAAIVSKTTFNEIDPTRKNIKNHVKAQEQLIMSETILPLSFGTIVPEKFINGLLEKNYMVFSSELEKLSDTIEAEVKIVWNRDYLLDELDSKNSNYSNLRKKLNSVTSPLKKQEIVLQIGKLVEKAVDNWKRTYAVKALNVLKNMSVETKENDISRVELLMDASFLINRKDEEAFIAMLNELDEETGGRLNFKYIGPLPPYNFLKMKLEM